MQSKGQIKSLLESAGITICRKGTLRKRRFGQNFLIDANLMRILVDSADITENDIVLEVGCGTGSLTEELAEKAGCVIAVEIDAGLAAIVREKLKEHSNVKIINADILEKKSAVNPLVTEEIKKSADRFEGRLLLVANLPYNIACPLMINLITADIGVDAMYVTVQREVAERMTAGPSNKRYGTLSILLNAAGDVKIIRKLPPSVFWPQPKVDSAIVSFVRNNQKIEQIDDISTLIKVVNFFMQHRRKMLKAITKLTPADGKKTRNPPRLALGEAGWQLIFEQAGINPEKRPDSLSPADFVRLANTFFTVNK